ncbi:MAG: hypothetical protein JWL84_117 [Rhodospirillales bacterium]|nr:hypothetical protein [Rhodospirillales bacterium]
MATIGAIALTYADWARRTNDDGKTAIIIELLSQTNEILNDMLVVEGNMTAGHKTTVRTGLPQATWRLLYQGVQPTKSVTAQITDSCGMLETYSVIDKALLDLNGNSAEFRLSEDMAFLEGMNQQMAQTLFYGNTALNPERFTGLSPRYSTATAANAATAGNVIDAGGTGSTNTSLWLCTWGPLTGHGFFPKAQTGGLSNDHIGTRVAYDTNTPPRPYEADWSHYKWMNGLSVRDWRYFSRICNIDVTTLAGGSPPNLIVQMIRALYRLPTQPADAGAVQTADAPTVAAITLGNVRFYGNRTIRTWLDIQALNKTNVLLQMTQFAGKPVTTFRGVMIKTCDQILNSEARVV